MAFRVLFIFFVFFVTGSASAQDVLGSRYTNIIGKEFGSQFLLDAPHNSSELQKLSASYLASVLGHKIDVLSTSLITSSLDQSPQYDLYVLGMKVLPSLFYVKPDGFLKVEAGLTPVEFRVPAILYPVGPLLLEVDGGLRFQADVSAQAAPTIMIPLQMSFISVFLKPEASLDAFIEGYAKLLVIRGGVGGQIALLDGQADAEGTFYFNGQSPKLSLSGIVTFLKGEFYAFFDYFNLLGFKWKRELNTILYQWKGFCYSAGSDSCP